MAGPEDDDALLARIAAGDRRAFATLADRHLDRAFRLARRMLGSPADAEDMAQEAFLRVWTRAAEWRPGRASFSTWLHRVVVNLCLDALRRPRHLPLDRAAPVPDSRPCAQAGLEAAERERMLAAALAALPERQRAAIALVYAAELSNADAAAALGISVGALEQLLVRARRALRQRLAADETGRRA